MIEVLVGHCPRALHGIDTVEFGNVGNEQGFSKVYDGKLSRVRCAPFLQEREHGGVMLLSD